MSSKKSNTKFMLAKNEQKEVITGQGYNRTKISLLAKIRIPLLCLSWSLLKCCSRAYGFRYWQWCHKARILQCKLVITYSIKLMARSSPSLNKILRGYKVKRIWMTCIMTLHLSLRYWGKQSMFPGVCPAPDPK